MNETAAPNTGAQALRRAAAILTGRGIERETAWLESRWLLGKAWNKKEINLLTALNDRLEKDVWDQYREMVDKRAQGEPLQYLLGEQEFMGLPFSVSSKVLIPRPDTETLVREALQFAQGLAAQDPAAQVLDAHGLTTDGLAVPKILDLGTGSGAIAVSLAYYLPQALLWAVDISRAALEVAQENAERNKVADRINFICGDLFSPLGREAKFNLVVANPPYISAKEYRSLAPEVQKEPCQALYGGMDGLDYYRMIAAQAPLHLIQGGRLMLEIGWKQAAPVEKLLGENDFCGIKTIKDENGHDRVISGEIN